MIMIKQFNNVQDDDDDTKMKNFTTAVENKNKGVLIHFNDANII